jgi:hypothetical protein
MFVLTAPLLLVSKLNVPLKKNFKKEINGSDKLSVNGITCLPLF